MQRLIVVLWGMIALATFVGCEPDDGIAIVGTTDGGAVVTDGGYVIHESRHLEHVGFSLKDLENAIERGVEHISRGEVHVSRDGGITWELGPTGEQSFQWGGDSVETPRGTYTIQGSEIILATNAESLVAFSAAYLHERGNLSLQAHDTRNLGRRVATPGPSSIVYDESSGNVVAAMGLDGVLVGTPDGQWAKAQVGPYAPGDYSISRKILLLKEVELLVVVLAMASSFVVAVVVSLGGEKIGAFLAVAASVLSMLLFGLGGDKGPLFNSLIALAFPLMLIGALLMTVSTVVASWRPSSTWFIGHWISILTALIVMLVIIALSFFQWVHLGTSIVLAKLLSIGLAALVALVLRVYLVRQQRPVS